MESKYENLENSPENKYENNGEQKVIKSMALKLKRSQRTFKILEEQNKQLQKHIDDLVKTDLNENENLVDVFEDYEKNVKKLQIDNECLLYQIKSYETLMKDDKKDIVKDAVKCIMCCDQPRNVLFRPCNHILICDECSGQTNYEECFVCRSEIVEYEYAYLV